MKKVVILGGGFAGVNLARDLGRNPQYSITLIDKNNYNFFPPLIYQVAAGFMSPSDISYPFRKLFNRHPRARYRKGTVTRVDTGASAFFLSRVTVSPTTCSSSPSARSPIILATAKWSRTPIR